MTQDPEIRVTWNIHWSCNYRCSYCLFDGHWTDYGKRNAYLTPDEWLVHWKRLHERHGRAYVVINGGEPFAYPRFVTLLTEVSRMHWPINVTTNGSLHLDDYLRHVDHSKVSLSLSFHPQYHTVQEFLTIVRKVREGGVQLGCLNFVAWPPMLADLPAVLEAFKASGESLKVIPFIGQWREARYPDAYSPDEKALLGMTAGEPGEKDWLAGKRRKGMLCRAGHRSALLLPDGKVTRCGQIGDPGIFSDFLADGFRLLDAPAPCGVELCPCDEWKVIPDEKTPDQAGAWLP
ncbi:MAG: hypothetical protein A2X40_01630 [Elusimicrobia bacterium GWC2_65_9]|nr:MAG: hypothetical protein A2X37_04795 [Elusimicrobia bacterium GWA2_66_18]OGR71932.1 MAG: hypothetical protein A2X40_01630 [Elusimicrobia bacterium GWC2_65_9]